MKPKKDIFKDRDQLCLVDLYLTQEAIVGIYAPVGAIAYLSLHTFKQRSL
jgi:hypothetical protein